MLLSKQFHLNPKRKQNNLIICKCILEINNAKKRKQKMIFIDCDCKQIKKKIVAEFN